MIMKGKERHFVNGLTVLSRLTEGKVFLCKALGESIPVPELESLSVVEFSGPHPAGNVGTHIHFLNPVSRNRHVWHVGIQDVIAVGILFTEGRLDVERVVSLAGPGAKNPRLIRTRIGASLEDITLGELKEGEQRIVSGSVFSGCAAHGETGFLGRFHQQISLIPEGRQREFLSWLGPGFNRFSVKNIVLSRIFPKKKFDFTTATHGGRRAIVPVGAYEKVMPLDIMPTYLLRALAAEDVEEAEKLGCLELDEEDLALCTFVCPSKIDHGAELRRNLTLIEKEG
jgi:Na+-transporting NADH:ubiquinone oxidoreductase subunit A